MAGASNRYKDRLFRFIFGNEKNKEWTLSLYNAMNGSNYTDIEDITINIIDDIVYMGMKNDVSFLVDEACTMNLYEQQSTYNPNMPIRFLIYAGMLYSKYVESINFNLYSSKIQKLPMPKCVCFYNGVDKKVEDKVLKLTDAFSTKEGSDVEVKVRMININYGHNKKILESCKPLNEYSLFVDLVRKFLNKGYSLEDSVSMAIDSLNDTFVIKPFLVANREEVNRMVLKEYDEERVLEAIRKECIEEGIEKGRKEGIEKGIEEERIRLLIKFVHEGLLTIEKASEEAHISVDEFKKILESSKD